MLPAIGYRSCDPDSALHAHIAARLAALPVEQWIAPEWWGGMRSEGPYREHPAGIFLLPALLGKLGYPPAQAAYAVNALYQGLTLVLVQRVAAALVTPSESRALAWLSLSDRKADRYIFSSYYLVGAGGLVAAMRSWPGLRCLVEAVDRHHPVLPAALWLVTFCLSLLGGTLRLPRLKLWAAE